MGIKTLNEKFSVDQKINIIEGDNGIPFIEVKNDAAHAVISLYGGQVLSYKPSGENDLLFLSELANYQQGKSIKGGIPVCWPWFGADPENKGRQAHGFARNKMWELRSTEKLNDNSSKVVMGLNEDEESLALWPYKFDLSIEITVGEALVVTLRTKNINDKDINITQALHTYLSIADLGNVSLNGLDKISYLDKAKINKGKELKVQTGNVEFKQEVDRIYMLVPESLQLIDSVSEREVNILSAGNKASVVWNPGADICQQMSDLKGSDYQRFVCVETANAASDVIVIHPGESFVLSVNYGVSSLG